MVSAFPSPVGNYRNLLMSVLSVIGFDDFFISSRFRALMGESDGLQECFRRSLLSLFPEQLPIFRDLMNHQSPCLVHILGGTSGTNY